MLRAPKAYIIGAGLSGLTIAQELKKEYDVVVLEQNNDVGGICQTNTIEGLNYEVGPHILYARTDEQRKWWDDRIKNKEHEYHVRLSVDGKIKPSSLFDFPISEHNLKRIGAFPPQLNTIENPQNFEEYMINNIGTEAYKSFVLRYNVKQWHTHPQNMDNEWASFRPLTIKKEKNPVMFGDYWAGHPGSYRTFFKNMTEGIEIIKLNKVVGLRRINNKVNGLLVYKESKYTLSGMCKTYIDIDYKKGDIVINTAPLDELFDVNLEWISTLKYFRVFDTDKPIMPTYSTTFPNNYLFTRIVEYPSHSLQKIKNKTLLSFAFPQKHDFKDDVYAFCLNSAFNFLKDNNIPIKENQSFWKTGHKAYPVSTKSNLKNVDAVLKDISSIDNFYTAGRLGLYAYISMANAVQKSLSMSQYIMGEIKGDRYEFYKGLRKELW